MRKMLFLALVVMVTALPVAAQFVAPGGTIPAVSGSVHGENGTIWRSNVSVLNLSSSATSVVFVLFPEIRTNGPVFDIQQSDPIPIDGNGQLTIANVVTSLFGEREKNGALSVFSTDGAPLVLASRTSTPGPTGGSFGLNVYGVLAADTAWIANVEQDSSFRTNVGIFTPLDPPNGQSLVFVVTVFDADGAEVASGSLIFEEAGLKQKNLDYFGVDGALLDGWVQIRCGDPSAIWYAYATVIDNITGDSVYRAAVTQESSIP
jgi:hypothetical protein